MTILPALGFIVAGLAACGDSGGAEGNLDQPACRTSVDRSYALNYLNGQFTLRADDIELMAAGLEFHEQTPEVRLTYDDGALDATMELTWTEREQSMAVNIYFTQDGSEWWADEIRTSNPEGGEWITYNGEFFRCPLGQYFSGSIELTADASNPVPGSLRFDQLWLRAFVGDEPPGATPTEIEVLGRPACEVYTSCGVMDYMNSCIYYWEIMSSVIRDDVLPAITECISTVECAALSEDLPGCWLDARPQPLPYHDEFFAACEARTASCPGTDYACTAYAWNYGIDLPYYPEELVAAFTACLDDTIPCELLDIDSCMNAATGLADLGI